MRSYVFEAGRGPTIRCSECGAAMHPTQYRAGPWRATFWVTRPAHSITGGSAYGVEPRWAVQRAA
jgi:hypothetical protein